MNKRVIWVAVLLVALFATVAWTQGPEHVRRDAKPPAYRDVLNGLVGRDISLSVTTEKDWWALAGAFLDIPARGQKHGKLVSVGADFVELRSPTGARVYLPLSNVILRLNTK